MNIKYYEQILITEIEQPLIIITTINNISKNMSNCKEVIKIYTYQSKKKKLIKLLHIYIFFFFI